MAQDIQQQKKTLSARPPIVVILGHIDHGKSSLLEAIKDFKIISKESGGITQHIGAYQIEEQGKKITFIDTPGHQAFSQMRARGAKVADIAILVVDAAEGVKPQTKEAISYIKSADIPALVALNKIDKPEADPEKVKKELFEEDFSVESLGGKIPSLNISAKNKKGINELLEMILLTAEMEELKADFSQPARGVVIESHLDNLRGYTATLLLTDGCLKVNDVAATDSAYAKVKSIESFNKNIIKQAFASDPVVIFGFNRPPGVGDIFKSFPDVSSAENYIKEAGRPDKEKKGIASNAESEDQPPVLNLIIKTDVVGLLEVIESSLKTLPQEKVRLNILKAEAGNINESDIKLAISSRAIILGFKIKIDPIAKKIIEREKVRIFTYEVIYDLVEKTKELMKQVLEPDEIKKEFGRLKVLAKFLAEKNRQIIGGRVIEGEIKKGTSIDVLRDDEIIGRGRIINLQRNKKDAKLVNKGEECGILFEGNVPIERGDILSFYLIERIKGEL